MATNICCSIESEPRTLNPAQLTYAMEAAADVVQNMEPKKASTVFMIQGLRAAVVPTKEMGGQDEENESIKDEYRRQAAVECCNIAVENNNNNNNNSKAKAVERPCQCSINNNNMESPDQLIPKEPLTAPF